MTDQRCPCGGIILADTENWETPVCANHYDALGEPRKEPFDVPIRFLYGKDESPEETAPSECCPKCGVLSFASGRMLQCHNNACLWKWTSPVKNESKESK